MTAIDVLIMHVGVIPPDPTVGGLILYASAFIMVVMVFDEIIDLIHLVARSMFLK